MNILLALSLLLAQYSHRSNPGTPGATPSAITSAGASNCPGSGCVCVDSSGGDTVVVKISGTWTATNNFYGVNNADLVNGLTALPLYPYNTTTGALSAAVVSTTANGTWQGSTGGFRQICVYASAFTSNTSMAVAIDVDPGSSFETVQGAPGGVAIPTTDNVTQFGSNNVATGTGASGLGIPRVTVSNDSNVIITPPTLTKGTQGSTGLSVQNLKDAGRTFVTLNADGITAVVSNTIFTVAKNVGGTVTGSQTTYTITSGKTFRVQAISFSATDTSTVANRVVGYFRLNTAGACTASSGVVASCEMSSSTGTVAANEGNMQCTIPIPDGLEITGDGTKAICMSESSTATSATITANLIGYEY